MFLEILDLFGQIPLKFHMIQLPYLYGLIHIYQRKSPEQWESTGIRSISVADKRLLERLGEHDPAYQWLTGMDDPLDWPLPLLLKILEASDESEDVAISVNDQKARAALVALRSIPDMHQLVSKFGPLPPAGPQRGDYFKMLRSILSSRELEFIVHRVLSGQKVTIEDIARRFRNLTLARLCEILNKRFRSA